MKINKEELAALADKSDKDMWDCIGKIASEHGYTLGDISPSAADLAKIRGALRGTEKINMREAMRLLNTYKKKQ